MTTAETPASGALLDVEAGATIAGSPARPHGLWLKNMASLDHLAEMRKELRELRREVERLRAAKEGK